MFTILNFQPITRLLRSAKKISQECLLMSGVVVRKRATTSFLADQILFDFSIGQVLEPVLNAVSVVKPAVKTGFDER
jgi:hypothetical protein